MAAGSLTALIDGTAPAEAGTVRVAGRLLVEPHAVHLFGGTLREALVVDDGVDDARLDDALGAVALNDLAVVLNVAASTAAVAAPLLLGRVVDAVTAGGPGARGAVLGLTAWLVAAALVEPGMRLDLLLGMLGPLFAVTGSSVLVERTYRLRPQAALQRRGRLACGGKGAQMGARPPAFARRNPHRRAQHGRHLRNRVYPQRQRGVFARIDRLVHGARALVAGCSAGRAGRRQRVPQA